MKTESKGIINKDSKVKINFMDKLKLFTGILANKKMKKFISKGEKRLEIELDIYQIR